MSDAESARSPTSAVAASIERPDRLSVDTRNPVLLSMVARLRPVSPAPTIRTWGLHRP